MNVQEITLDVSKLPVENDLIRVRQNDENGVTVVVTVLDHGGSLDISGFDVTLLIGFTNGVHFEIPGSISNGKAVFDVTVDDTVCGMTMNAYVQLTSTDVIASTSRFAVEVLESAERSV